MKTQIFTIGVYGLTSDEFFGKLVSNKIDTFIDIRRRRAVRGSEYSFVNSNRLQARLAELRINYIHAVDLSPTDEIRSIQKNSDKATNTATRKRDHLDDRFIETYRKSILDKYNFNNLLNKLDELHSKSAVFFCVEAEARACHRSLITDRLHEQYSFNVVHL
jgi:uncharacterized protein (DUF488 family)